MQRLSVKSASGLATPQLTIQRVSYDYANVLLTVSDDADFSVWVDQNGHHECPQSLAAGSYQIECLLVLTPTEADDVKGAASDTQAGTVYGTDNLVTPLPSDVPRIYDVEDSQEAPSVWQWHSVSAWVDPEGANTTWHVAYGTTPSLGTNTPDREIFQSPPAAGTNGSEVTINGLSPSTTYYYSVVATNIHGTTTSPVQSFTTVAADTTTPNTSLNYAPAHFQGIRAAPGGSGPCAFLIIGEVEVEPYVDVPFQAQISVGGAINVSIGATFQNADGTYHGVSYVASGYGSETCGAGSAGYGLKVTASLTTTNAVVEDDSGHELGTFTMTVSFDNLDNASVPASFSADFTPASAATTTTAPSAPPSTTTAATVPSTTTATTTAVTTTTTTRTRASTSVLPNKTRTPGVTNPAVTQATIQKTICVSGWTAKVRPPVSFTNTLKLKQMRQYGEKGKPTAYEEDHFIPLELGGAPKNPKNLWPEPHSESKHSDPLETSLKRKVCTGTLTLAAARSQIVTYKRKHG